MGAESSSTDENNSLTVNLSDFADLILIGDLFYEPELVTRVGALLERAARRRAPVLYADRATARRPPLELELIADYKAALTPHMEIGYVDQARVWQVR